MLILFGPIIAQLVSISAGDRTEGRVAVTDTATYVATTRPAVSLALLDKQLRLQLQYSPSFTLAPLESNPQLLVFQTAGLTVSYGWRHTTLTVSQSVGWGTQNFQLLATGGAANPPATTSPPTNGTGGTTPSGGTPSGTGGQAQGSGQTTVPRFLNRNIRYLMWTSSVSTNHALSRTTSLGAALAYTSAGSVETAEKANYPTVKDAVASLSLNDRIERQDSLGSTLFVQRSTSSNGSDAVVVGTTESWNHNFDARTSTQLGAGLAGSRVSRTDGYIAYSIYPTFVGSLVDATRLWGGSLATSLTVGSSPALDPVTLVVDPRISLAGSVGWQRDRFSATCGGNTAFSVSGHQQNALSTVGAGGGIAYQFVKAFAMDAGVRTAYQVYQGQPVLPFTYAAYVGMTLGLSAPLN
jgi:hypothetical protein